MRGTLASIPGIPAHDFLEHTGELRLRIRAGSLADLFGEAGRALGELSHRSPARSGPVGAWQEIEASASDAPALLVAWLNELIFAAERDRLVPAEFDQIEASETRVRGRMRGPLLDRAPALVKAATLDRVCLRRRQGLLEAEVTLDI